MQSAHQPVLKPISSVKLPDLVFQLQIGALASHCAKAYTDTLKAENDMLKAEIKDLQDEMAQDRKGKPDREEIVASIKKALNRLRYVNCAYYVPVETKAMDIIVLHSSGSEIPVLDAVIERLSVVEDKFPDVDFRPVVLGADQVGPDTLTGAQRAF